MLPFTYLFAPIHASFSHSHAQEVIRRAPQLALRWLKGVCPPQIFLDRALGKQVCEVGRKIVCSAPVLK